MVRDDCGFDGADPPVVVYHYAPGRGGDHAPAATTTNSDALKQRRAFARRAGVPRFVTVDVVRQSSLVGHELLPADVTRVSNAIESGPQFFIQKGPLSRCAFSAVVGVTEGGRSPSGVTPTTAAV